MDSPQQIRKRQGKQKLVKTTKLHSKIMAYIKQITCNMVLNNIWSVMNDKTFNLGFLNIRFGTIPIQEKGLISVSASPTTFLDSAENNMQHNYSIYVSFIGFSFLSQLTFKAQKT